MCSVLGGRVEITHAFLSKKIAWSTVNVMLVTDVHCRTSPYCFGGIKPRNSMYALLAASLNWLRSSEAMMELMRGQM